MTKQEPSTYQKVKAALEQRAKAATDRTHKTMVERFLKEYEVTPVIMIPLVDEDLEITPDDPTWRILDKVRLPNKTQILDFPAAPWASLGYSTPTSMSFTTSFIIREIGTKFWYVEAFILAEPFPKRKDAGNPGPVVEMSHRRKLISCTFSMNIVDGKIGVVINAGDNPECVRRVRAFDDMIKTREFYPCNRCDRKNEACTDLVESVFHMAFAVVKGICYITMPDSYVPRNEKSRKRYVKLRVVKP